MAHISWNDIQDRATEFASKWSDTSTILSERGNQKFWSDFLDVYGIDSRRHGAFFEYAVKKGGGAQGFIDMFWPGKLLVEQKAPGRDLQKANLQAYEYLETMPDHDLPQAIVVSDFQSFIYIAQDGKNEKIEFTLQDLPKHVKLFAFLLGETSQKTAEEQPVNRQAAEAMARLHNQLRDDNYTGHDLELLLVRLVFCMFADDSGIFEHGQLRGYVANRTAADGSDLGSRLVDIFQTINTPREQRQHSPDSDLMALEYVNGGLFAAPIRTPHFSASMRRDLLAAMELDWSQVSPAIFGSMFQGVMDEQQRRNLGAHYTSEKNILRVIKPLFLDDLYTEFAHIVRSTSKKAQKLHDFQAKLASLKFLDPACGSGNFLVITYRELRRLEHKVIAQINKTNKKADANTVDWLASSEYGQLQVNVDQMYGIEIEEFPSLIAQTALWLTDQQMNMEFSHASGKLFKRLPLIASATIVNANALTTDWATVIEPSKLSYILGNPPFLGQTYQSKEQKQEVANVLSGIKKTGVLDFVSAWYGKAADIMKQNQRIQTALVSTNSITQGEQVAVLWNYLLEQGVKINFAHRTFKWTNDAKGNAAVHCVIIGFALFDKPEKRIFEYDDIKGEPNEVGTRNINPYLVDAPSITIDNRSTPMSDVPIMAWGNKPTDGGHFILTEEEKASAIAEEPSIEKYIHRYIGGGDFLNNNLRYCLWLKDADPTDIKNSSFIKMRVERVRTFRAQSTAPTTQAYAEYPTLFRQISQTNNSYLAIPEVSSERRRYVPIAFFEADVICSNTVQFITDATLYHFGILTSGMHMAWMRAVAGRLKSDYRYSKDIVYNNFIWPEVTNDQHAEIERLAQAVLDARAQFPTASLADLYDPLTMPPALSKAHKALDRAVDKLYQKQPFPSDPARVAHLFELYTSTMSQQE